MLSQTKMVNARKAIESMYVGTCKITEYKKVKRENKTTGFEENVVLENEPCRLSFKTIDTTNQSEIASSLNQVVKVFLSPEIKVKPGSKLTITQNGVTTDYMSSGEPAIYSTHQEIILELFKGWA